MTRKEEPLRRDESPDGAPVSIALIATVYNCRDELRQSLDVFMLEANLRLVDEVVVADGGSSDGTWEILQEYAAAHPKFRAVQEKGANICRGRNLAVRATDADVLVVFDSGTAYGEEWLGRMIRPFREDPSTDVVEGATEPRGTNWLQRTFCHMGTQGEGTGKPRRAGASHRCIAYRRAVWERIGGYPEHVRAGEDTWFNMRVRKLGFHVRYVPEARCTWEVRDSFRSLWRMQYRNAHGHIRLPGNSGRGRIFCITGIYLAVLALGVVGFWVSLAWLIGAVLYGAYLGWRLLSRGRHAYFLNPVHFLRGAAVLACMDSAISLVCLQYGLARCGGEGTRTAGGRRRPRRCQQLRAGSGAEDGFARGEERMTHSHPDEALILRAGRWDVTPAQARAAGCLTELGYRVTILAWDVTGTKPAEETVHGWRVRWFRRPYPPHSLKYLLYWLFWWRWVLGELKCRRYRLVHAMNMESVFPCIFLRKRLGYRLVYDLRDSWGQGTSSHGFPVPQTFSTLERWAARHVDGLLLSQGRLDLMGEFFGPRVRAKTTTIQVLNVPQKDMVGHYQTPRTEPLRLNVSGNISYLRNIGAILELAGRRPSLQVDIVGDVRDQALKSRLEALPNLRLYGWVPYAEAMRLLNEANLVAITYDMSSILAVVSSANKMFDAMMMSRPFIASAGGFPGHVAEAAGAGWTVPYGDTDALVELVDRLQADPSPIERAARLGRETYERHFRWERQKANLMALYRYLLQGAEPAFRREAGWDRIIGSTYRMDSLRAPQGGTSGNGLGGHENPKRQGPNE